MLYYIEYIIWDSLEPEYAEWGKSHLLKSNYENGDRLLEYVNDHIYYWVGGSGSCLCCTNVMSWKTVK